MKANEFVEKFGFKSAKYWIDHFNNVNTLPDEFINIEFLSNLKHLIKSHELVELHGYEQSKEIIANAPSDDHFYSWTLGDSGVRDKTVNIGELRQAIADVESCL